MRSLEKSPWRLRSPAVQGWVFSFASGPLHPTTGRAVVQKKEARATRWLNSKFNSVYESLLESLQIKKKARGPHTRAFSSWLIHNKPDLPVAKSAQVGIQPI